MIGKTLAHYSITAQLGKGGMGEVYKAKDTKLGRDVAIKVLPEEFAQDTERVARFQREAKLLASLNHPNIAAIHGLEEFEGTHFLVLELIEGDTLAERIKSGPVPVEEALKLGLQIAEALEAAHEKGVIHRDLKPANIKVTPDGKVKVLDFGLAKAYAGDSENINLSNSPTLSDMATQQGVILGTAAYMPPEQAKGKSVDKRADIWAFGVVLFEMITGKQLFSGESVSETLAAVIKSEPEWNSLPPNLHPRIRLMLERCLEKEPKNRYGAVNDARVDIEKVLADPGGVYAQPVAAADKAKSKQMLVWAGVTVILLIIAGTIGWNLKSSEPRQAIPYNYELPEEQQISLSGPPLAVSPDGKQIVYCAGDGIYRKAVNELNAELISGSDGASNYPFFSPDGKSIAYFSFTDSKLKRISIDGGSPTVLCEAVAFTGGSWLKDDYIVYGSEETGVMRVSSNGGTPEILMEKKSENLLNLQALPNGKAVLYLTNPGQPRVMIQPIKSEEPKELFAGWFISYLANGYILYYDGESNLCAVKFDTNRLEDVGEHVPLIPNVEQVAVSDSGTLIYTPLDPQARDPQFTLVWVNREGIEEPIEADPHQYDAPTISPDGKLVAITIGGRGRNDIWIWDIERKILNKLTREETNEIQPVWTPDSKQIIYHSDHEDFGIYQRQADGAGEIHNLISQKANRIFPYSISSDGKILLIDELATWLNSDIGMLSLDGDREKTMLLQGEYNESGAQISPDSGWIAYTSDESGTQEVFVRSFPEVENQKKQASKGGGNFPLWSPDEKELFYLSADNHVMVVSVSTKPTLELGPPVALFPNTNRGYVFGGGYPWDIHPIDKRFLMIKPPAAADGATAMSGLRKIIIVLNWDVELKEKLNVD